MYKILIGLPAMGYANTIANEDGVIIDYLANDDEDIWCDFELDYDLEEEYYYFNFETMLEFDEPDGCRNWIMHCFDILDEYMTKNGYDKTKELNMYEVFTEGRDIHSHFKTIEEAYVWLKMMVYGFHGKGLE